MRGLQAIAVMVAGVSLGLAASTMPAAGAAASPEATCTWGGTPATPTGTYRISPGLTNTASTAPAKFKVTGELGGAPGCSGTFSYSGQIDAGGTCAVNTFRGRAKGLRGVSRFAGVGVTVLGPAQLYDRHGNIVGSETAQFGTVANAPHFNDCSTPQGLTGGNFSSVIVLFPDG
jgi:hypothetical protein